MPHSRVSALAAVPAEGTRSQRRTYLEEYVAFLATALSHAEEELALDDLVDDGNASLWLAAVARGMTRLGRAPTGLRLRPPHRFRPPEPPP